MNPQVEPDRGADKTHGDRGLRNGLPGKGVESGSFRGAGRWLHGIDDIVQLIGRDAAILNRRYGELGMGRNDHAEHGQ